MLVVILESGRLSGFGFFQVNMRWCCVTSSFGTVLSLARDECAAHGPLSGFRFFQVNMSWCCVTSSFGTVLSLARDECAAHGAARPRQHAGLVLYI